jgi:type VI secretion system protein
MLHDLRECFKERDSRRNRLSCFAPLLYLAAELCGCASRQLTVRIDIVPGSNSNSAIAVDLVSVTDGDLAKQVAKLTAADWFGGKKDEFLLNYSKPGVLRVDSGEWISGQRGVPDIKMPAPKPLKIPLKIPLVAAPAPTVFVFANYLTPGPHRATLQPRKTTTIQLGLDDLKVMVDKK